VVSDSNKVFYCYTAETGGAWTLISTYFSDADSVYSYTAAVKGGVFYAENSEMDVSGLEFTTHEAYEGGVAYLEHPGDVTFQNINGFFDPAVTDNIFNAYQFAGDGAGGVFYIVDDAATYGVYGTAPTLTLDTWEIQYASAEGDGGFAYVDLADLDVVLDTMLFEELLAEGSGGGFYALNLNDISLQDVTVELTQAPVQGSFLYSESVGSNI